MSPLCIPYPFSQQKSAGNFYRTDGASLKYGEGLHISANWSSLCSCKQINLQVSNNPLWGLFWTKVRYLKCRLLFICYCWRSHLQSQWKHLVPKLPGWYEFPAGAAADCWRPLLPRYTALTRAWSQWKQLLKLVWVQVILKPLITPCTCTV